MVSHFPAVSIRLTSDARHFYADRHHMMLLSWYI